MITHALHFQPNTQVTDRSKGWSGVVSGVCGRGGGCCGVWWRGLVCIVVGVYGAGMFKGALARRKPRNIQG